MNREAIYKALFNKLNEVEGFNTTSRKLRMWTDVPTIEQPAMFLSQTREVATRKTRQKTIWRLYLELYLYANTGELQTSPSEVLNPLVDAIVDKLEPVVEETQTLGGLVEQCFINGDIDINEGILGQQGIVIIPIEILTT